MIGGCLGPPIWPLSRDDKIEIIAALIRHDLSDPDSYLAANLRDFEFYLTIEGDDPSPEELLRLSTGTLSFSEGSAFPRPGINTDVGLHMRMSIHGIKRRISGGFEIEYGFYCGSLCASGNVAIVERVRGSWTISESRLLYISGAPHNKPLNQTRSLASSDRNSAASILRFAKKRPLVPSGDEGYILDLTL